MGLRWDRPLCALRALRGATSAIATRSRAIPGQKVARTLAGAFQFSDYGPNGHPWAVSWSSCFEYHTDARRPKGTQSTRSSLYRSYNRLLRGRPTVHAVLRLAAVSCPATLHSGQLAYRTPQRPAAIGTFLAERRSAIASLSRGSPLRDHASTLAV
jgi:hypothetical protein